MASLYLFIIIKRKKGAIHKGRPGKFDVFWPPPPVRICPESPNPPPPWTSSLKNFFFQNVQKNVKNPKKSKKASGRPGPSDPPSPFSLTSFMDGPKEINHLFFFCYSLFSYVFLVLFLYSNMALVYLYSGFFSSFFLFAVDFYSFFFLSPSFVVIIILFKKKRKKKHI